ncbi:MAG TPA: AtpZ/AtpI family protein [Candidatus Limnocylindrales bacterium]|nr:AtpZ/AtpI family protein [Candidatus Limnocylindrales bacterium]
MAPGKRGPTGSELAGLSIFLASAFILPFVGGLALDAFLHTSPVFLFVGLVVGIAAATVGLYGRLKRYL